MGAERRKELVDGIVFEFGGSGGRDWVLVPKGNSEGPWSCRAYLHHQQWHRSGGAAEIAPWGVRDKEAVLRSQISRPRNVRLTSPASGEGKPTEREFALRRSCLHSTATVGTWTVTGSQVRLCHFPGCQCRRGTVLSDQMRHQRRWSRSPSTMTPIKSLAQKYHPGREREKGNPRFV